MDTIITGVDDYLKSGMLPFYYLGVALIGLFLIYKYRYLRLSFLLILIFWEGLFIFISNSYIPFLHESYKIVIVIIALLLFSPSIIRNNKPLQKVHLFFFLFTFAFWLSFAFNEQSLFTSLSQYGKKYLLPFLFLHRIFSLRFKPPLELQYSRLIRDIIIAQIILSFFKLILLGFGESVVGSITFGGGGLATTVPILGFLFLWIKSRGKLERKDWILFGGLLIIALASNKRAPVFILPLLLVVMYVYVDKSKRLISFIKYIPLFIVLVYLGIITNPTLNPERSRWGTFDMEYVTKYVREYMFGSEKELSANSDIAYGRGGSLLALFSSKTYDLPVHNIFFGQGIAQVLKKYDEFENEAFNVKSKGDLNGALTRFISYGLLGLIFHLAYGLSIIFTIGKNRLSTVFAALFLWDYFLYNGLMLEHSASAVLFIFIICIQPVIKHNYYDH